MQGMVWRMLKICPETLTWTSRARLTTAGRNEPSIALLLLKGRGSVAPAMALPMESLCMDGASVVLLAERLPLHLEIGPTIKEACTARKSPLTTHTQLALTYIATLIL